MTEEVRKSADISMNELHVDLESHGLELTKDGYIRWNKRNPAHPRNWATQRKAYNTGDDEWDGRGNTRAEMTTALPADNGKTSVADQAQHTYGISQSRAVFAFTSTYVLGQGIGGIFFPSFSEAFGRKALYITSTFLYCIFCVIAAAVPSFAAVVVARLMTGILSAIPTVVVAGSIEDLFNIQARVWVIFCWVFVGNLGLVLGPIFSTYVTVVLDWQSVFYVAAIVTGITFVLYLSLDESRPSLLLEHQVSTLPKASIVKSHQTRNPDYIPNLKTFIDVTITRPIRLLFTEPIVIMVTIMDSVVTALYYLQAESLIIVYISLGFSRAQASLSLIPVGIGCLFGFLPRFYDDWVLVNRRRQGKAIEPEDKLFGFALGAPILAAALWWFAWTIPPLVHTHYIVSMLALIPAGFAMNDITFTLLGYLADSYTIYAASAFAGGVLARSLLITAIMPFTHGMYTNITANSATSILAVIGTLFCVSPYILLRHGKRIRMASPFAQYSLGTYTKHQVEDDMNTAALPA